MNNNIYECKRCGNKQLIQPINEKDICKQCGVYIFTSVEIENKYKFMQRLKRQINKQKNIERGLK